VVTNKWAIKHFDKLNRIVLFSIQSNYPMNQVIMSIRYFGNYWKSHSRRFLINICDFLGYLLIEISRWKAVFGQRDPSSELI
jgi:hypothetical protein